MAPRLTRTMALAVLLGAGAHAGDVAAQANCDNYGRLALKQQQENEQRKCGLKGPEWNSDLRAHVAWCGTVGPDQWKLQLQRREQALAACSKRS